MSKVQLYVYDLSNGLARQLSLQMTGKQIDGIWHTSVVVFGKEIFYGQGISITLPGKSHHGTPAQIIDMGESSIDEATFEEYLNEIKEHYTADKYHLLDFNCNSFTNDCVGFLTGGSIPSWIKDLPQEFLSTPFGAALRPTIDNMYRRPAAGAGPSAIPPSQASGIDSLLGSIAAQASSGAYPTPSPTPRRPSPSTSTLTAPLQIATNPASLNALISSRRCVSVFFTSATCPPCKMVEPIFEELAKANAGNKVAFVKVDVDMATGFDVRATPTFWFYLDGKKMGEIKGADAGELRTQVNLLLFQAFPPHPHTSQSYPTIRAISLQPILFTQPPAWDAVVAKLNTFIEAINISEFDGSKAKTVLTEQVVPFLRARFSPTTPSLSHPPTDLLRQWSASTASLVHYLPAHEMFPVVDLWRLGLLDDRISAWVAAGGAGLDVVYILLSVTKVVASLDSTFNHRNLLLTMLRLLANCFVNPILARHILSPVSIDSPRERLTALLVLTLLHTDALVRTAAASLAFNIAAHQQKPLVEAVRNGRKGDDVPDNAEGEGQGDWEVEVVSAIVEALKKEENEQVVHRLTASLALFLHLSPYWNELASFIEVVGVKDVLEGKLDMIKNGEVKKLVKEVVEMCC